MAKAVPVRKILENKGDNLIHQGKFSSLLSRYRAPVSTGIVFAFLVYFLLIHPHPGFPKSMDYTSWLAAGEMVTAGQSADVYNISEQIRYQADITYPFTTPGGLLVFNRPPFFILPFIPLSLLPFNLSYILWVISILITGAVAFWVIVYKVQPGDKTGPRITWEWGIISLAFFPVFQGILLGQTSLLELLILTGTYLLLRRGKNGWAGAVLALGAFKPQLLIFFIPIFIFLRAWRGILFFAVVGFILAAVSTLLVGVQGMIDYVNTTNQVYAWNCINGVYPELHQSWRGLLIGLMVPPCTQPELASAANGALKMANQASNILNIATIIVLLLAWLRVAKSPVDSAQFDLVFAFTITASLIASPYSNPQELTRLVLFAALLLRAGRFSPGLVPPWLEPRVLTIVAIIIGPLVMTEKARAYHPFVWLEGFVLIALVMLIFGRDFLPNPQAAKGVELKEQP